MHTTEATWPIWTLLRTVFGSILEVGLLCVAGYLLARRGILDKKTQKHINRLNISLFTPSLLFSKVAFFLTPEKLKELWVIPILFFITTGCSMLVAYVLGSILHLKTSQKSFAMASAMFMNSNSLPVALMQSIVYSVKALRWGDDDTDDAMLGRALTYLVLYSTLGMILRWSYGVRLLSQADEAEPPTLAEAEARESSERTPLLVDGPSHIQQYTTSTTQEAPDLVFTHTYESSQSSSSPSSSSVPPSPTLKNSKLLSPKRPETHRRPSFFPSFPNTPVYPRSEASDSETEGEENGAQARHTKPKTNFRIRLSHSIMSLLRQLNDFMTVPMWAALASLVVACVRPMQHALEEHMQPVKSALNSAGNCSIPLTLVVLGAYFFVPEGEGRHVSQTTVDSPKAGVNDATIVRGVRKFFIYGRKSRPHKQSPASIIHGEDQYEVRRPGETRTVVAAVLSRMVLTPLILLPVLAMSIASGATSIFDDPVFALANVLLITSAPALTLAQITQAASGDAFERLISRTIFWSYCVLTPVSTVVSVMIGLIVAKL